MNRRDTILIAGLVNAALLIALFVTAIKRDDSLKVAKESHLQQPIPIPDLVIQEDNKKEKEIDQILKEFSEKSVAVKEEPKQTALDFAKELEAITKVTNPHREIEKKAVTAQKKVIVQKGDTLDKIARIHQVTVKDLMSHNHLSSSVLQIGQPLLIPEKGTHSVVKTTTTTSGEAKFYTVKQGDNPWSIAVKNKIKLSDLLELNQLNEEKAKKLRPGDQLRIQ